MICPTGIFKIQKAGDMKRIFVLAALILSVSAGSSFAGGAAAMKGKGQQQQMMMQQQQMMIQQKQMIAQRQQMMVAQQMRQKQVVQAVAQKQLAEQPIDVRAELLVRQTDEIAAERAPESADLSEVLQSLKKSARDWPLIVDREAKEVVISYFIDQYRRRGVTIEKPPAYYVDMIDGMSEQSPDMLVPPFENVLRIVATLDYDFANGQDKDRMVLQLLKTREAVMKNRARLGMPTQ